MGLPAASTGASIGCCGAERFAAGNCCRLDKLSKILPRVLSARVGEKRMNKLRVRVKPSLMNRQTASPGLITLMIDCGIKPQIGLLSTSEPRCKAHNILLMTNEFQKPDVAADGVESVAAEQVNQSR